MRVEGFAAQWKALVAMLPVTIGVVCNDERARYLKENDDLVQQSRSGSPNDRYNVTVRYSQFPISRTGSIAAPYPANVQDTA